MRTIEIYIENLKCKGCASTIKKGLLKQEGVKEVVVDVEDSKINISYQGDKSLIDQYNTGQVHPNLLILEQ